MGKGVNLGHVSTGTVEPADLNSGQTRIEDLPGINRERGGRESSICQESQDRTPFRLLKSVYGRVSFDVFGFPDGGAQ